MSDRLPATVPPPTPPDDPAAWYAPAVRDQYAIGPDLVATVTARDGGFAYRAREPPIGRETAAMIRRVVDYLADVPIDRPKTREGTVERLRDGLSAVHDRVVDRLADPTPAQRRRLGYHLGSALDGLDDLTPLALDDRIRVADASGDSVLVHTDDFAPATTHLPADHRFLDRFAADRIASYEVEVFGTAVPVTVVRARVLGDDAFSTHYHVRSPISLPGDDALVASIEADLVDAGVGRRVEDPVAYVERRARRRLRRKLIQREPGSLLSAIKRRLLDALAGVATTADPARPRSRLDRVDELASVVVRDLVGEDRLSVPLRDPHLERIEANRVGERVKVVPRPGAFDDDGRLPTSITFDDERRFVGLATRLAGAGGVELGPNRQSATVALDAIDGVEARCTVSLPDAGTDDPYIAIDKRGRTPASPIAAVQAGTLSVDLLALLWLAIDGRRSVLFVGPDRARPASLVEAHAPFIPYGDRPVTVAGGTRTISLPHETGVTLSPDVADESAALERADALAPDVSVMAALDGDDAFQHLGDALAAGRGVLASATATDASTVFERATAAGVPASAMASLDVAVVLEERTDRPAVDHLAFPGPSEATGADAPTMDRTDAGALDPDAVLDRLVDGDPTDRRAAFERRRQYVRFLVQGDRTDADDLFAFLADLRTDEAATLDRIHRVLAE
ncbi:MAG: secretion system protein [Halanaeroarchaeum sp.]